MRRHVMEARDRMMLQVDGVPMGHRPLGDPGDAVEVQRRFQSEIQVHNPSERAVRDHHERPTGHAALAFRRVFGSTDGKDLFSGVEVRSHLRFSGGDAVAERRPRQRDREGITDGRIGRCTEPLLEPFVGEHADIDEDLDDGSSAP